MADSYIVKQGDHLSRIANKYGFTDYHSIWDHADNAALKQQRKNPNVLYPGDQLYIPDRKEGEYSRNTDIKHRFLVRKRKPKLRLVLEDIYEKPIANAKCVLVLESGSRSVTTDGQGKIEQDISPNDHDALLIIQDTETAFNDTDIPIKIGNLDPVEEISGQIARLNNLGYFAGVIGEKDDDAFLSAVEEFQCDHGLQVDGDCGPATQSRLKQVHGC
jgi:Putative peptidoglycan binding domain/LysM domain